MDWDDLKIFEAVAGAPTLSAAARGLKVGVATVSRRIEALEAALDLRLVERTPDGVRLTPEGEALATDARAAAYAMEEVGRRAEALRSGSAQPIRISATEPIAAELLAPAIPALLSRLPDLKIELSLSNAVVSLASRHADIALRQVRPKGESLLGQRLPTFALGLFASAAYLAGRNPRTMDLRRERLLSYDDSYGRIAEVAWIEDNGLAEAARVRSSSTRFLINATVAGAGVGLLPRVFAWRHPELVAIAPPTPIPDRPLWLMSHKALQRSPRHRAVRLWILETLRAAHLFERGEPLRT